MSHAAREKWLSILEQHSHSVIRTPKSGSPDRKVCACMHVHIRTYMCVTACVCEYAVIQSMGTISLWQYLQISLVQRALLDCHLVKQ